MRGIRGAVTVAENKKEAIFEAVELMVTEMCRLNGITAEDIGAAIFTATEDITAAFPATGARKLEGFASVPLFDARQMDVDGALPLCIRLLMLVDIDKKQKDIKHVYLGRARDLRLDLAEE